jgi:hypothetical protein
MFRESVSSPTAKPGMIKAADEESKQAATG